MSNRLLIVEDDNSIAALQRDYLELSGYRVDMVESAEAALEQAQEHHYDLIILDLMLPGVDGFTLCKQLRETLDIPLLIVSARQEEADKVRGLGLGADDYVSKPFSPGELVARVKSHLARYQRLTGGEETARDAFLRLRGLSIDQAAHRVWAGEREVALTNKEFELLLFLATHPNRVFSREQLFEQVWGWEALGDSATVTVHIKRLRDKIEIDPANPQLIETVWGAGYRFRT